MLCVRMPDARALYAILCADSRDAKLSGRERRFEEELPSGAEGGKSSI